MAVSFNPQKKSKSKYVNSYNQSKTEVLVKIQIIEKDLQFDAAAIFNRKTKSPEDFVDHVLGHLAASLKLFRRVS